jgi:RimJ/RimL family protein N-acetyltransferase
MRRHDVEGTRVQIEKFERQWAEDGLSHWATVDLESGRLIGRIGLLRHHDWPLEASPVEVGWVLDQRYWGRGLATEGGRASMGLWREHLRDDPRLLSITAASNRRSRAVMERLGLTYRGTAQWHDRDVVWYAIERN